MGHVYLARQQSLGGRFVALKVLPESLARSHRARRRFLTEAHALARLHHPNVVAVYDVIEAGETCAYAMEWIDGASLGDVLDALRPGGSRAELARTVGIDPKIISSSILFVCRIG